VGVACGVLAFAVAMLGTLIFCIGTAYLSFSGFGSRRQHNAVLRLQVPTSPADQNALVRALGRYTPNVVLINLRDVGSGFQEHSYHLKLRDLRDRGAMLEALGALPGVSGATLLMQDTSIEP
jgi:hypothetical protein